MAEGSLAVGVTIEVVMMFCAMALDAQRHTAGFLFSQPKPVSLISPDK